MFSPCEYIPALASNVNITTKPKASVASQTEDLGLRFHTFDPIIPCADGSPAGIYIEENPKSPNSRGDVFVAIGDGGCTSAKECEDLFSSQPFLFTSRTFPSAIKGDNVLSVDPEANELHYFTKWLLPCCSQDFFLGDLKKGRIGNFTHAGSAIFDAALQHWKKSAISSSPELDDDGYRLETVVVVGTGAGGIGVMNKVDKIRAAINSMKTRSLKVIIDSSTLSSLPHPNRDYKGMMSQYVDLSEHRLCEPLSPFDRLYERSSALTCCLSKHCLLRHDDRLSSFFLPAVMQSSNATEELLLLDSAYDLGTVLSGSSVLNESGLLASEIGSGLWGQFEHAGARKMQALDTASKAKVALQQRQRRSFVDGKDLPRVKWIISNCLVHTLIAASVEFLQQGCLYGSYADMEYSEICVKHGKATHYQRDDFALRIWQTTDSWEIAEFEGESIHRIVVGFVLGEASSQLSAKEALPDVVKKQEVLEIKFESCHSPNCQSVEASESRTSSFIRIESYFVSVPVVFLTVWSIILFGMISAAFYIRAGKAVLLTSKGPRARLPFDFFVRGLSAITSDGKTLLQDVHLRLRSGRATALCGRSGSGKSTLLKALSRHELRGVTIKFDAGERELSTFSKAFVRQHDDSEGFGKLTPDMYLQCTASILGAPQERLNEIGEFCELLFDRGVENRGPNGCFDPFKDVSIENLSGGQRRILNIAATLLVEPNILLLDEPLSGLDSASSIEVMSALSITASVTRCAVVLILHQPSQRILSSCHRLTVLGAGRVIHDKDIAEDGVENATEALLEVIDMPEARTLRKSILRPSSAAASLRRLSAIQSLALDRVCHPLILGIP